jgi:hypothetical protein
VQDVRASEPSQRAAEREQSATVAGVGNLNAVLREVGVWEAGRFDRGFDATE